MNQHHSGHDEDWDERVDSYVCSICRQVCRDAVCCNHCFKYFCAAAAGPRCPNCLQDCQMTPENFMRQNILGLQIKCPFGCGVVLKLQDKGFHISQCTQRNVCCPKCQEAVPISRLETHQRETCLNRAVRCSECHVEMALLLMQQHVCAQVERCPLCEADVLQLGEHLERVNVAAHFMELLNRNRKLEKKQQDLEDVLHELRAHVFNLSAHNLSPATLAVANDNIMPQSPNAVFLPPYSSPPAVNGQANVAGNAHGDVQPHSPHTSHTAAQEAEGVQVTDVVPAAGAGVGTSKILLVGLSPDTTEEKLAEYFSQFGSVAGVMVKREEEGGWCTGAGMVSFERDESADLAVAHSPHMLGRPPQPAHCSKAVPKVLKPKPKIKAKKAKLREPLSQGAIEAELEEAPASQAAPAPFSYSAAAAASTSAGLAPVQASQLAPASQVQVAPGEEQALGEDDRDRERQSERLVRAVQEGLFQLAEGGQLYYSGPRSESGHANFCERFTKAGGAYCVCRGTHTETYVRTQVLCKHGGSCRYGRESCGFVHLAGETRVKEGGGGGGGGGAAGKLGKTGKADCNRGYQCSGECAYLHHPEALKVWKKRGGKGGYHKFFREQACPKGADCNNKLACNFYHHPREAFCAHCAKIGHPHSAECKARH